MAVEDSFRGFDHDFLIDDTVKEKVPFPKLGPSHKKDIAPVEGSKESILNYHNYSVQLSASRKFPFFTAANINGGLFKDADRAKSWKKDKRAKDHQWGLELYKAAKSDFDKGHMTKREDVQWGITNELAQKAADSTFYYSNAVPQYSKLNQRVWKSLEDYILNIETKKRSLKICVFTGPVLSKKDPPFVTMVDGQTVLIPVLFWKVVVFPKEDGKLYRVGFLMSQKKLLTENGIVHELEATKADEELFMQFEDAGTYQVNTSLIEKLADITLPKAIDSFKEDRSIKLVLEEVEVDPYLESYSAKQKMGFSIQNIVL
ncbi:MAG: DNA/RNA non-specific endonuclease [Saprospiraceae bacterium]